MENKWVSLLIRQKALFPAGVKFARVIGVLPNRDLARPESVSNSAQALPIYTSEEEAETLALEVWESEGGAISKAWQSPE